jgi:hypothetical protein
LITDGHEEGAALGGAAPWVFVEYPQAQAVEDGRAADYRIVVPTLTDTDLRRFLI